MDTGPETPQPPPDPHRPDPHQPDPHQYDPYPPTGYRPPGYPAAGRPSGPPMRPDEERIWAIAAHLGPLALGFVAPLVVWLVFKDRSAFLDRTGKEALNMQISYAIYAVLAAFSIILLIGLLLLPVVMVAWFVLMIVATVKVASFEDYRYPAIIRFVK